MGGGRGNPNRNLRNLGQPGGGESATSHSSTRSETRHIPLGSVCGDCAFFDRPDPQPLTLHTQNCHGYPPRVIVDPVPPVIDFIRPTVDSTDIACNLFLLVAEQPN